MKKQMMILVVVAVAVLLGVGLWALWPRGGTGTENAGGSAGQQAAVAAVTSAPAVVAVASTKEAAKDNGEKIVLLDAPQALPAAAGAAGTAKTMDLLVEDAASKEPISGAQILTAGVPVKDRFKGATEIDGHVKVPVPEKATNGFNIEVHPRGYVYVRLYWNRNGVKEDVPASYTVEVEPAGRARGKVVDEAGNPVAGANVVLVVAKTFENPHVIFDTTGGNIRKIKTNAGGTFSYTGLPEKVDSVEITAWDYHYLVDMNTKPIDPAKLKDGSAVVVLHKGVLIDGQAVDTKGVPLIQGTVTVSEAGDELPLPPQTVDENGKFAYAFSAGEKVMVTVASPGYVTQQKEVTVGSMDEPLSVQMELGRKFTGQIVDSAGKGIANANIFNFQAKGQQFQAGVQSDAEGKFTWDDAPAGTFTYSVTARGYKQLDNQTAPASEEPVTVTLKNGLHVHGTVVDAETGKLIGDFRIVLGIRWEGNQTVSWQPGMNDATMKARPDGTFDFPMPWNYPEYALRVEADGHYPAESRVFKSNEDDVALELKMKPGADVTAKVVDADGKPQAGVKAIMATPEQYAYVRGVRDMGQGIQAISDENGMVKFPPLDEDYKVVAVSEEGFAEVDSDGSGSPTLTLQPWGRIEGTLMIGAQAAANAEVELRLPNSGINFFGMQPINLSVQDDTKTDGTGHFVFDHVPPGKLVISRLVPQGRYGRTEATVAVVEVKPGETVKLTAGGKGRPVTGKIVVPETVLKRGDTGFGYSYANSSSGAIDMPPMPEKVASASDEDKRKWYVEYLKTKQGKAFAKVMMDMQLKQHQYPVSVGKDGTFRIEDVEPGHYHLQINVVKEMKGGGEEYIGIGQAEFSVLPMEGGRSDEAQVLPDLQASMNGQ